MILFNPILALCPLSFLYFSLRFIKHWMRGNAFWGIKRSSTCGQNCWIQGPLRRFTVFCRRNIQLSDDIFLLRMNSFQYENSCHILINVFLTRVSISSGWGIFFHKYISTQAYMTSFYIATALFPTLMSP
jgi:hypothetical protein